MNNVVRILVAGIALCPLGCSTNNAAPADKGTEAVRTASEPDVSPQAFAYGAASNDGRYFVAYTPRPNPIPLNEMFELDVMVFDSGDAPTSAADVALGVDGAMPEHEHGMNTAPVVVREAVGRFKVSGMLFHMSGYWQLYFDVTRGPVTERAQFDVRLD